MDILIHVANVLFLGSYLVKDILWLRALSVLGGGSLMAYQLVSPSPVWAAVGWNVVFSVINVVQIKRLLAERRPVSLAEDELRLYQLAFRSLSPRELVRLLRLASWETVPSGRRVVTNATALDRMMIVFSGRLRVSADGKPICELGDGQFVGEMSFLTGEPPRADVDAETDTRIVSWPKDELRRFLGENPELRAAWQTLLGADLVGKLRTA